MGLGTFRVRLLAASGILMLIWVSIRAWSPSIDDSNIFQKLQVKEDANNRKLQSDEKLQRVLVTVYYEALCPDSRSFVMKQLQPTYEKLSENIEVSLIPYGKATTKKNGDDYEFSCQHGPIECEANMIHACAIDNIKDPAVQLEFISCMIKNNLHAEQITRTCGERMNLDVQPILDCAGSLRGKELLAMYGKKTDDLRPQATFIPTITLDEDPDNLIEILKNLLDRVCRRFKVLPAGCTQ